MIRCYSEPSADGSMTTSAEKYVHDNYWVWVVVGVLGVLISAAILIACLLCCYQRRRKRRRNGVYYVNLRANLEDSLQYGSMELQRSLNDSLSSTSFNNASTSDGGKSAKQEVGVAEAWTNQRKRREVSEREAAQLACQYYLRNTRTYSLINPLPDLGSRVAKYWFLVSHGNPGGQSSSSQRVLTLQPVSKHCPIRLQRENLKLVNDLLVTLKHPYLHSVEYVDYLPEQSSVVMVMTFFPQGSLKDIIYKRQPTLEWSDKYSIRRRGLPQATVALYGRQILEALRILYRKGFPPLGNLQSGNVFVNGNHVCQLSGYENTLLGYRSRHYRLVKDHLDAMDTIMFGHLLFEMMCGYELTTLSPSNSDLGNVRGEAQVEVLRYIFSGAHQDRPFPNIIEILNLPFFKSVKLPEIENWDSSQIQLSTEMKGLLKGVRKGRSEVARVSSQTRSFPKQENYYPVTPAPAVTITSSQNSHRPSPPTSNPPPPPSTQAPPPSNGRGALLIQIRGGKKLKRTLTNDRSDPRI